MKKNVFYVTSSILLLIAAVVFFVFQKPTINQGEVLGSSINNFYASKRVKFADPPKRRSGVMDPKINSSGAILIDQSSKYILYSLNEDAQVPIASITKVMTAAVALDLYKPDDVIIVDDESPKAIPSKIYLKPGEKIRFSDLLYGMLMSSGNDAAQAIARGKMPEDQFIKLMNQKSEDLGLQNSTFRDSAGLDDNGRSSAHDVAFLFAYILKNQTFQEIISTSEKEIFSIDGSVAHKLKNSDRLITGEIPFDGMIGGKTGYTPDAGHTLVAAAQRNNHTLVSVVLKTKADTPTASAEETKRLLEWGFNSYDFN